MNCSVKDCNRKHEARGLCKVHYNKEIKAGRLEKYPKRGRPQIYTDEQRKQIAREKTKRKYYNKKGYAPGERPKKDLRHEHPSYTMWYNAKARAKTTGLPFDLILEELVIPNVCPLLGIEIKRGVGNYTDNSPTIDRIIPELGYVKSNIWIISMRANRIKDNATIEELQLLTTNLLNKINQSITDN